MIDPKNMIIEDINYFVYIKNDRFENVHISVNKEISFKAKLIVYLESTGQLIFNLLDNTGTVIIPLNRIYYMVPLVNKE